MLVSFRHADFDALTALWNRVFPAKYQIDRRVLELNTVLNPLFDWGASQIELDDDLKPCGFAVIKASARRLYPGPEPDTYHLSAIVSEDNRCSVDLLAYAKAVLRERGIYALTFGRDWRHFWPGCPLDVPRLKDFLIVEGFDEEGSQVDVVRDLVDYEPRTRAVEGAEVRPLKSDELAVLDDFLVREFPGRWRFDTMIKTAEEKRADFIYSLWLGGELHGFALTQDESHQFPGCGAVWRGCLGSDWCCLGPIGVSDAIRGSGHGDTLLSQTLVHLKSQGKRRCLIDWTSLTDWYGKHGFEPTNTYLGFTLRLDL